MTVFKPEYETMKREDLRQVQLERLQSTVTRCYRNVKFYRKKFDELGLLPEDITSLDDLQKLPFTVKDDLRKAYPYEMFSVPLREIVRIHSSSGTTGHPTVVGYTARDLRTWSELCARMMSAVGVTKDDVIQIAFGYGLFTGAFGLHQGAEVIGASVIPTSVGNTRRQILILRDYKTSALVCTPSYAITMAESMEEQGVDPKSTNLKVGLFGSEPWSESMRAQIEERLFIKATDNYGLSEIMGPGVAGECLERCGHHIAEDHFLPEIIDPETGAPAPEGGEGELVISTLTKEGLPLLRYRTRDITRLHYEPCACGRTLVRMERVRRRSDDMLIIRGVNVYPQQIEHVLLGIEGAQPHYLIVVDRKGAMDQLEVQVEVHENLFQDEMKQMHELKNRIQSELGSTLGISVKVKLVEPKTLERSEGKVKRVVDNRKND
jgi:phenylacetate-CoA ligase